MMGLVSAQGCLSGHIECVMIRMASYQGLSTCVACDDMMAFTRDVHPVIECDDMMVSHWGCPPKGRV